MFRSRLDMPLALLLLLSVSPHCPAESLWQRRDENHLFMFHDTKPRRIGDLLTVVIRENTDVANRDQRALEKEAGGGGVFGLSGSTASGAGGAASVDAQLDATASHRHNFDGSSQYNVARDFSDRITVSVVDVLPNGTLVIEGKRSRIISGEERTLVVSGLVRPRDVNPDNTVNSPFIANFQVNYEGHGQETRYTNKFQLGRKLTRWWRRR